MLMLVHHQTAPLGLKSASAFDSGPLRSNRPIHFGADSQMNKEPMATTRTAQKVQIS